jgi:VWFA-related protein
MCGFGMHAGGRKFRFWWVTALLAGVGLALPAASDSTVVSTASTESSVDLIVRDRHGRAVRDLQPGDLRITEDGATVTVRKLELRSWNGSRDASRADAPRFVSLVVDQLGDSGQKVPRDVMQEMAKRLGAANVFFSVWSVRDRVRLLQPFTRDQVALKHALGGWRKGSPAKSQELPDSKAGEPADVQAVEQQTIRMASEMVRDQHSRPSAALLFALAQEQRKLPGRKTVLYVSDGLQVSGLTSGDLLAITGVANRSQVSFYSVDVSGISDAAADAAANLYRDATLMGAMMDQAKSGPTYKQSQPGDPSMYSGKVSQTYTGRNQAANNNQLRKLALDTGGIYFNGSNLRNALNRVAEDITTYYEISYSGATQKYDGHFCPMTVSIDRARVQTQARSGYFSMPPFGLRDISPFEVPMLNALTGAERQETIWFRCAVTPGMGAHHASNVSLRVAVPINGLVAREDEGTKRFRLHVAMLALVRAQDGHVLKKLSRDILLEGPLEGLQQARKQTYKLEEPFDVSTNKYLIDIAIADQNAGKLSTKTIDPAKPEITDAEWNTTAPGEQPPTEAENVGAQQAPVKLEEKQGFEEEAGGSGLIAPPELMPNAVRPGDRELQSILDGVRQRTGEYKRRLPNFVCLMKTKRFVDPSGRAGWKLDDSYTSALRYDGTEESALLLDVNGKRVRRGDQGAFEGASVTGEFGETLGMIFSDRAHAHIEWLGMAQVLGARAHVFKCTVAAQNSEYRVVANRNLWLHAAYHAFVYVDANSLSIWRLTIAADDIPASFPIKESGLRIDYDYVPIGGQEYLLPIEATLRVRIGRRYLRKNEIEFQNYHKYLAESRLRFDSPKNR